MKIDLYTKAILTVIAAALVWLMLDGRGTTTALAQDRTPTRVIVVGWEDPEGYLYRLPPSDRRLTNSPLPVVGR